MKKLFKPMSLFLAFLMIFSCFTTAFAVEVKKETFEEVKIKGANENVSIIIELEQKPLLDCIQAQTYGAKEYLQTDTAKSIKQVMIDTQKMIQEEITSTINSEATFKFNYTNTINGFAAVVQRKDIFKIKALPGVKAVYMDLIYEIPEDDADPRLQTSAGMIGATNVWGLENYKGEGTVVAVIDTGVDVNHEYMVVSDSTEVKLTKESIATVIANSKLNASSLVSGLTADDVYYNRKFPYCFDYIDKDTDAHADSNDHGVHVSGIVAANGTVAQATKDNLHTTIEFNGVAPEAQIIGMKVFSSSGGGAPTSCTIAAVEDAVSLGVDAINLSLGSTAGYSFYEGLDLAIYEEERSFAIARKAGVVIAVAAGNEDRAGILSYIYQLSNGGYAFPSTSYVDNGLVGSPGTKYHATTVASMENQTVVLPYLTSGEGLKFYYNDNTDFVNKLDGQTLEYVVVPGLGEEKDFEGLDVTGKIALIERGTISFSQKVLNAQNAGAFAAIIYNNAANGDSRGGMLLDGVDIPAILIGRTFGLSLVNAAEAKKTIIIDSSCTEGVFQSPTTGLMSDFTSWGCTPDLKLKPEVTAPGTNIYSTSTGNQYVSMSGTSMAAPHIAGAAALLQQYVKDDPKFASFTAQERGNIIESLLMSTADIIYDEIGGQYSPRRQGSGLANIEKAINSNVYLLNTTTGKAKVELGDKLSNTFDIEFDAYNLSDVDCDYELVGSVFTEDAVKLGSYGYFTIPYSSNLNYAEMFADGHTINPGYALTPSGITGSAIVTVPAGGGVHIKVTVELDEDEIEMYNRLFDNGFFVEGFIEMIAINETQPDLSIPYMGFYGDWNKAPILDGSYYFENYFDDSGTRNFFYGSSYPYSYQYDSDGNKTVRVYLLGSDHNGENYSYNFVAFSPNGDQYLDEMGYKANFLRNPRNLKIYIINSNGETVNTLLDDIYWRKTFAEYAGGYYLNSEFLETWDGKDKDGNLVGDGQYYYVISASIDYDGAIPQNTIIPVKIDTQAPTIESYVVDRESKLLTIEVSDNTYVSHAVANDSTGEEIVNALEVPESSNTFVFDITNFADGVITVSVGDVAGNEDILKLYSVTYNLNGGKINDRPENIIQTVVENECAVQPSNPINGELQFDGWYLEGATEAFDFTTPITSDITLYAKYIAVEYDVTFNLNGGNINGSEEDIVVKVEGNNIVSKPEDPQKNGYRFDGWYLEGATEAFDFTKPITSNLTLYAKYTKLYSVTYNLNGGNINGDINNIVSEIVENECVVRPADPIKVGYSFIGWFEEGSSKAFNFKTPITKNLILIAKYSIIDPGTDDPGIDDPGTDDTGSGTVNPTDPDEVVEVKAPENSLHKKLEGDKLEITLDESIIDLIKDGRTDVLLIETGSGVNNRDYSVRIPNKVASILLKNNMSVKLNIGSLVNVIIDVENEGDIVTTVSNVNSLTSTSQYTYTNLNFDIFVKQGEKEIANLNKSIKVEIIGTSLDDINKAGVYTIDDKGNLEYVMTYLNGDVLSFYPPHFSPYSVMVYNKTFNDIKDHWAQDYIESMASKHITNGKTESIFDPNSTITRSEFVTMVIRALGLKGEGKSKFANITSNKWYANYMSLAKDAGLIEGTTYNAEGIISRLEMAKIIARAHAVLNGTEVKFEGDLKFKDIESDSEYAEFIGYAAQNGLINGFPEELFMPVENTTRAQAITVIFKLINK